MELTVTESHITWSDFKENESGIFVKLPSKTLIFVEVHLCNFTFNFKSKIIRHFANGDAVEELEVEILVGGKKKILEILLTKFDKLISEITKKLPECCLMGEGQSIAKAYLREFAAFRYAEVQDILPEKNYFYYHGWQKIDGAMRYLSNSDENCECEVTIPKISSEQVPEIYKTGQEFLKVSEPEISVPFFLYLHIGYAAKLFEDAALPVQFLMLLVGKTGSLKTTLCKTFALPFNADAIMRLESTARALELCRESSVDMTMVADDIFRQTKGSLKKFEQILRPFGDGIGRAKSTGKGAKKILKTRVRGGCIVTAESDLNNQQSSMLRSVTVNIEKAKINLTKLSEFQQDQQIAKRENRPNQVQKYFAAWICYLEKNYQKIVGKIIKIDCLPIKRREQIKNFPLRYQKIAQIFLIVADVILNWGFQLNVIKAEEYEKIFLEWEKIIFNLLEKNVAAVRRMEDWQKFLVNFQSALATGAFSIAADRRKYEVGEGKFIGFVEGDEPDAKFICSPVAVWAEMQKYDKNHFENRTQIFRELFARKITEGYEITGKDGKKRKRYLKKFRLNKLNVEMLVIHKLEMEKAVEEIQTSI